MRRLFKTMFVLGTAVAFAGITSLASAQSVSGRFHNWVANSYGGTTCGRTISQQDAEGLWENYCYDDCTIHSSGGCGAGGACKGSSRSGLLGKAGCGGFGARASSGNGACGCQSGCFGWPTSCCNTGSNDECGSCDVGRGSFLHRHSGNGLRMRHHGFARSCGCDDSTGCDGGHGLLRRQSNSGGLLANLKGCGNKCGFFSRIGSNFDACSPISSCVGNTLTNSCGCDGGHASTGWNKGDGIVTSTDHGTQAPGTVHAIPTSRIEPSVQ